MAHALAQVLRAPNAVDLLMAARPPMLELSEDTESEVGGWGCRALLASTNTKSADPVAVALLLVASAHFHAQSRSGWS